MAGQQDGFALGVDLGTSNTVAVLRRPDGRTRPLLVDGQPILPSGVYADTDGRLHVGRDAQRLAQADPTRYEPNPKRRVDEPAVPLGERAYPPAELLAATLSTVADAAVAAAGFLPPAVVTHPAAWEAPRRQVLADALALAGWPSAAEHTMSGPVPPGTRLLREPVAAARYFTEVLRRPVPVGGAVAVFDFGGGTLDVAVVRNEGADPWGDSGFTVISTGGMADLGGLDLDAALVGRLGETVGVTHPGEWARLTRPTTTGAWRDRQQLWENVRGAKEMLSRAAGAPVAVPGVEAAARLTRDDLERLAAPLLARAVAETRAVVTAAGLAPDQLAGLFLVGGSSRIPLVARMLHADLGVAPTVLEQPELPVAEGALTDLPLPRGVRRPPAPVAVAPPAGTGLPPTAVETPGTVPDGTAPADAPTPLLAATGRPDGAPTGRADATPVLAPPTGTRSVADRPETPTLPEPARPPAVPVPAQAGPGGWPGGHPAYPAPAGPPGNPAGTAGGPGSPVGAAGRTGVPESAPPVAHPAGGGATGPRRARWIAVGAGLALVGVVAAAVLWFTRDPYPPLDFHPLTEIARPLTGPERPQAVFTAILDDRAYLARQLDDDRLEVVGVDAGSGDVRWRATVAAGTDRWAGIRAVPGAVAVVADAAGDSSPRDLVLLDAVSGKERWRLPVHGDDALFYTPDTAVRLDRAGGRLVGLRLRDGRQVWEQANPRNDYGDTRTTVLRVGTDEATGAPTLLDGTQGEPWRGEADRLVQVGADRSVRVLDLDSGKVLRERSNVADVDEPVAAYDDRLYVAEQDRGYKLLGYDLDGLAEPAVLYSADDRRRPTALVACGAHRACLLEVPDGDAERTELVVATEGKGVVRRAAPRATSLLPVGGHVVAQRGYPERFSVLDLDDDQVPTDRKGVAARLDGGNLLALAEAPSSVAGDPSVAGMPASGGLVELGDLQGVRSSSCSWNTEVIACGTDDGFVLYRFAGD